METFTFEGHTFATDLFWENIESRRHWRREAKQSFTAENIDVNAGVLRLGETLQAGLCKIDFRNKTERHVFSAAGIVAKAMEVERPDESASYIAAVPVEKAGATYWYVTGGDSGLILSDFDRLFADEDEAADLIRESVASGDWALIIAPDEWGVGATESVDSFAAFLPRDKKGEIKTYRWWQPVKLELSNADMARKAAPAVVFVGLAGLAYGLTPVVMDYLNADDREPEPVAVSEPEPEPPSARTPEWETGLYAATDLVRACEQKAAEWPLIAGAWDMQDIACTPPDTASAGETAPARTVAAYTREPDAPVAGLESSVEAVSINWSGGGTEAFAAERFELRAERGEPTTVEAFWRTIETMRRAYPSVSVDNNPYPEQTNNQGDRIPPPPGQRFVVRVQTPVGPSQALAGLTCSVERVDYTVGEQIWQIEGQCYARN